MTNGSGQREPLKMTSNAVCDGNTLQQDPSELLSGMKSWLGSNRHPVETLIAEAKPKKRKKTNTTAIDVPNVLEPKQQLRVFLALVSTLPHCYNMDRNEFNRTCNCCQQLAAPDVIDCAVEFLSGEFCQSSRQCRQVIEKAMMDQADADRQLQKELQNKKKGKHSSRYSCNFRISFLNSEPQYYCTQTWRVIYCVRRTRYKGLQQSLKTRGLSPSPIKNAENNNRWKNSYNHRPDVISYLEDLKRNYSEPTATRFVRLVTETTLRDDVEVFELPPSYTKRKLYERYCFQRGHKVKADAEGSYPKVEEYPARTEYDDVLWPIGSLPQPVCSWYTIDILNNVAKEKRDKRNAKKNSVLAARSLTLDNNT